MESIFSRPPFTRSQHYKELLRKKELTVPASQDCFAPASSSPPHLYSSRGLRVGAAKTPTISQQESSIPQFATQALSEFKNPELSVVSGRSGAGESGVFVDELQRVQLENVELQRRVLKLESLLKANYIEFE